MENAPINRIKPTREDGTKADADRYTEEMDRMRNNESKFSCDCSNPCDCC